MKTMVNKKRKGFVLAYASILMAVVMILIAGITSLITVMSKNNQRISDSFYQSVAVDQTLEYFVAIMQQGGVDINEDGQIDEQDVIDYANGKQLFATIESLYDNYGSLIGKTLLVKESENSNLLLLKATVSTLAQTNGKIIYLAYGVSQETQEN